MQSEENKTSNFEPMIHPMKKMCHGVELSLFCTLQKLEIFEEKRFQFFSFKAIVGEKQPIPRVFEKFKFCYAPKISCVGMSADETNMKEIKIYLRSFAISRGEKIYS